MTQATQVSRAVFGFDPGPRTGLAAYLVGDRQISLMGAYSPDDLLPTLDRLIPSFDVVAFSVEDWENYGRRPGFSANLPNRVIGLLQGYAYTRGIAVHMHPPSRWKRSFSKNVSPIAFKGLGVKDRTILSRLIMECGGGVLDLVRALSRDDLPHAVDAAGVAVYGAMALGIH